MKTSRSIWEFFLDHHRFTKIIVVVILLVGTFSMVKLPKESEPEIDFPVVVVSTVFPGASAGDVEELITKRLEDKLVNLEDVDEVTSSSRNGLSVISILFDVNTKSVEKLFDAKDKVDQVATELPEDAIDPSVQRVRFSDLPILNFSLSGPYDLAQMAQFAEQLKDVVERVAGVSRVVISGDLTREVRVLVDKAQLDSFDIGLSDVTRAIGLANSDIPAGNIETGGEVFALRFAGRVDSPEEVRQIPITVRGGIPVFVQDVATVLDGYREQKTISRLSVAGGEAQPSVSLSVHKVAGGDILVTVDAINQAIEKAKKDLLPDGITIVTAVDNAEAIRRDLGNLVVNGLETIAIVVLMILFFLGWREALLAGIAIPLTFLITFGFLYSFGYTLNFLTLFSLILSLGILVDSAIVVTEAIHIGVQSGKSVEQAARDTIHEFQIPLASGTLTTIFAFLPMVLTSGIMGLFIKSIPITVSIVLLASLFIALAVITTLSLVVLKKPHAESGRQKKINAKMQEVYGGLVKSFLNNKKKSRGFLFGILLLFFLSLALPVSGILPVELFNRSDEDTIYVDVSHPIGTPAKRSGETMKQVEDILRADNRIVSFTINVGATSGVGNSIDTASISDGHLASAIINLDKNREEDSSEIIDFYQRELSSKISADIKVQQIGAGPGDLAPVQVTIKGADLLVLDELAQKVQAMLLAIPGTRNVEQSVKDSNGELVMHVDRASAEVYGVSTQQIAGVLRNAITGSKATIIKGEGDDIEVIVKYGLNDTNDLTGSLTRVDVNAIEALTISTPRGNVPLGSFITSTLENNRGVIQHKDGDRIVTVTSLVTEGTLPQTIFNELEKKLAAEFIPDGYTVGLGGEREDIQKSFGDMMRALGLGVLMIGALMVWQFRSYRQPFLILVTIPLALIGVFFGLSLINVPLSFPGVIGVVALAGIVVNNAIILIDRINNNRRSGLHIDEAIVEASGSRLQPILLTTVTTVAGILPLALTNPVWGPLGYSIVFGLIFSTVLTLIVVPLLYQRFAEKTLD